MIKIIVEMPKTTEPVNIADLTKVKEILMPTQKQLEQLNEIGYSIEFNF